MRAIDRVPALGHIVARALGALLMMSAPLLSQRTIHGVVTDSLRGGRLRGATVQLVPAMTPWLSGAEALTDSTGSFTLTDVALGDYLVGFRHPRLDSLGMDNITRSIRVSTALADSMLTLAIPSALTLVRTFCGERRDTTGVLFGRVFDADAEGTVRTGRVVVQWGEVVLDRVNGLRSEQRTRSVPIDSAGKYVLCGVPTDGSILLRASVSQSDSAMSDSPGTDAVRVDFPAGTLLHQRDLVMSTAIASAQVDAGAACASTVTGRAQVDGRVLLADGTPVAGARVSLPQRLGADSVLIASGDGRFVARGLAPGTTPVYVTAVGYGPAQTSVNLRNDERAQVTVTLSRVVPVMNRVEVRAPGPQTAGFAKRRKAGFGRFYDAADLAAARSQSVAMQMLRVPFLRMTQRNANNRPVIRGRLNCVPYVFLDGVLQTPDETQSDGVDHADTILPISQVGGIEVYAAGTEAPGAMGAQHGPACAAIVIWSKTQLP
jgi:hypothetical protein